MATTKTNKHRLLMRAFDSIATAGSPDAIEARTNEVIRRIERNGDTAQMLLQEIPKNNPNYGPLRSALQDINDVGGCTRP